jgi:hypothetical protein
MNNGNPKPMKIGFGTSLHAFSYAPQQDITAWESTQAMVFLMHLLMLQTVRMAGAPPKVWRKTDLMVESAWKRLEKNVARHFEVEEVAAVAEVKKPGLILPGGR